MKYFDYAASCPLDKEAAQVYIKAATEFYGNSSSLHDIGEEASSLLENCRRALAELLAVEKDGIYFTSGGSESNFLAIHALLSSPLKKGKHIITGMAEHSSVLNSLNHYEVTALPFNSAGQIEVSELKKAIREDTILITIQHGNPEIGSLQPIEEISKLCKENDILFHSDCVQTFGKVDAKNIATHVDSLSISGHKFYGPKGIGAAYINPRVRWNPFLPGTVHENGFRPGTVNVPAIAAMITAAQTAYKQMEEHQQQCWKLRTLFLEALSPVKSSCVIYGGDVSTQLPSTLGMRVKGLEGQFVMLECNRFGFAISTGSACQIGLQAPSKTMTALGLSGKPAKEFIRISFGKETTENDVQQLAETIIRIIMDKSS
ncbi:IscS subfamily cysteine desulfurase [Bacillus sp. FJAT-50079]|uniref:IscS subfamily cysteine desulfurase n=1 Tax=Bacillus sp. FJAT-50079 TaxID=2833577 RepID=UPI001BC8EFB6|nr:IscS subfamily cysteine desulfurase [Bacillus sp. FJAT-50079]MBS4210276.1 IscS subfamily cysteine desulfurase [Bacillus sp. FJAT-50079]